MRYKSHTIQSAKTSKFWSSPNSSITFKTHTSRVMSKNFSTIPKFFCFLLKILALSVTFQFTSYSGTVFLIKCFLIKFRSRFLVFFFWLYPVILALYAKDNLSYTKLSKFGILLKNQLAIFLWDYFLVLYSVPLFCVILKSDILWFLPHLFHNVLAILLPLPFRRNLE